MSHTSDGDRQSHRMVEIGPGMIWLTSIPVPWPTS